MNTARKINRPIFRRLCFFGFSGSFSGSGTGCFSSFGSSRSSAVTDGAADRRSRSWSTVGIRLSGLTCRAWNSAVLTWGGSSFATSAGISRSADSRALAAPSAGGLPVSTAKIVAAIPYTSVAAV